MARTMINETNMAKHFWAEAINTACYIQNRISIRPILNKTPYELWKNKKPNISYFHPFGCVCFILNTKDHLGKFDSKAQKCFLLGYFERSKGYRVYNTETLIVEESINIRFDDNLGLEKPKQLENFADIDIVISEAVEPSSKAAEAGSFRSNESEDQVAASLENLRISEEPTIRRSPKLASAHSEDVILGKKDDPIRTRAFLKNNADYQLGLVSLIEPTSVDQALEDPYLIIAMQEELNQFTRNDIWDLVPRPDGFNIIGTK